MLIAPSPPLSTLLRTHSPLVIELAGSLVSQFLCFWIPSTVYLLSAYLFPDVAHAYKTQPQQPLPTLREIASCTAVVLRNQLLGLSLQTALHLFIRAIFNTTPYLFTTRPSMLKIIADILLLIPLCEIFFYSFHLLLHRPSLYRRIHKVHHSFTAPIALAAQYSHPIEYVLTTYVPIMLPAVVVRAHVVSMWIFAGAVGFESCSVHSGFRVGKLAERHDRHHENGVKGGYGTFEFMDWLCGTEMKVVGRRMEGVEAEKQDGEKGERGVAET